jgi:hypothetical protein
MSFWCDEPPSAVELLNSKETCGSSSDSSEPTVLISAIVWLSDDQDRTLIFTI